MECKHTALLDPRVVRVGREYGVSTGEGAECVGCVGIICLHLSVAGPSQVATCSPNQPPHARCSPVSFLHKMSFEDVEERDGVQFVHSRTGGFISSLFQAFDCRGTFGLRLALRPIAP
jgi:hypothetical protein